MSDIISFTTRRIDQMTLPKPVEDPVAALMIYSRTGLASSDYCQNCQEKVSRLFPYEQLIHGRVHGARFWQGTHREEQRGKS